MSIKFKKIIPFIFLCLASCSLVPNELQTAEQLMESKPDSALRMLQNIKPQNIKFDSNRALFGLLMFQALDENDKTLQPDSLINFSIEYYQKENDQNHLAKCNFYKGRMFMNASKYEDATTMYLKVLDNKSKIQPDLLWGKLYCDLGNICYSQQEYKKAREKFIQSSNFFYKQGENAKATCRLLDIGRTYSAERNYKTALRYYQRVLVRSKDPILTVTTLQEIGINYFHANKLDSSKSYLLKSLNYPNKSANRGVSFFTLADVYFNSGRYDSAYYYSSLALNEPMSFVTERECYRILVDVEYHRKDIVQMGKYMTQYQSYSDSIKKVESQTKSSILEDLHNTTQEAQGTKRNMSLIISILIIILLLSVLIVYFLYKRNKIKKNQLEIFKQKLNLKQDIVNKSLGKKIKATKDLQAVVRRNAKPEEEIALDTDIYNNILHLKNWDEFKAEMNSNLNQIVDKLESNYSWITKREIVWCCLELLDIPNNYRLLLLNTTPDSLYKLKQRLAKKMNLNSTKELDSFLLELTSIQD